MRVVDADEDCCTLELDNFSAAPVTGFAIDDKEVSQTYIAQQTPYLIPAGATYRLEHGMLGSASQEPPGLVLHAALFTNGGWAGEANVAARIAALQVGAETQYQQIKDLFERFCRDSQTTDNAKLALLRGELDRLSEDPSAQAIHQGLARFPDLKSDIVDGVIQELKSGLHVTKHVCGFGLREFERNRTGSHTGVSLSDWWNGYSARIVPKSFCSMRA